MGNPRIKAYVAMSDDDLALAIIVLDAVIAGEKVELAPVAKERVRDLSLHFMHARAEIAS